MGDRAQLLNDQEEGFRLAFDGRQVSMWTAIPGIVNAVDLEKMVLEVQPAITASIEDENGKLESVNLPVLINVPIVFPGAGGFVLTMPIAVGDEVLVIFASRCIDAWWQNGGIQKAMEARMHDLSDGFAIPGIYSQPNVIPSISATAAQLRNKAGTSFIEIGADGKITLAAPAGVSITGDLTVSGSIGGSGGITDGGISLTTHKHTGVTTGGGTSGGPVP